MRQSVSIVRWAFALVVLTAGCARPSTPAASAPAGADASASVKESDLMLAPAHA
jgi:PBP1b-binding outer membrane lipoprotein LpoB